MIVRNINYEEGLEIEREKNTLERKALEIQRHETTKSIQMWLMLHPDDYEYINLLIQKLGKINKELEAIN